MTGENEKLFFINENRFKVYVNRICITWFGNMILLCTEHYNQTKLI